MMIKIKNFEPREYQKNIVNSCINKNCLVVLPTGLGKTKVSILLSETRLNSFPNSKILFLTPTKPLANQIYKEFIECLDIDEKEIVLFTGEVSPLKRKPLWEDSRIIISTPQGLLNDITNKNINIKDVSLLILDEAHRCVGDYDYVQICKMYYQEASFARIIGLTASPGSDVDKINEVCKNAFIEEVEIRVETDLDVAPYVQDINIDWVKVDLPDELIEVRSYLQDCLKDCLIKLKNFNLYDNTNPNTLNKKDLISLQSQLQGKLASGERNFVIWGALSILAKAIKVFYAIELLETQGLFSLEAYLKKIIRDSETTSVKAIKNLVKDINFKSASIKCEEYLSKGIDHPKIIELIKIVKDLISKDENSKLIVFNQYRTSAHHIEKTLNKIDGIRAKLFVGQLKKGETGLSQKEQHQVIDKFKKNEYNVLISTSIGEEGLDIPKVDTVIFYEPVPSAIRSIQRRGRTARQHKGHLIILITKKSRDESYHWVSQNKEKRMYRALDSIKKKLKLNFEKIDQKTIASFSGKESSIRIIADYREKSSNVIKELANLGIEVTIENLSCGDYVLSDRVCIEFKTQDDFINSIIDGRLMSQMSNLKNNYQNPLLIICGDQDIYTIRKMHPNSIRGMFASIALNYGIPILFTKNLQDTAALMRIIALREQKENDRDLLLRTEKKPLTQSDLKEYIVQSLPGVGPTLSRSLLNEFKTIKSIINLSEEELQKIEKIGPKKASDIYKSINEDYEK